VGLGNPGPRHSGNRHNAGFWFVQRLCAACGGELRTQAKFFGKTAAIEIGGSKIRLLCPETYMNLSGRSIAAMCGYFQIEPEHALIAHDEIDLPVGTVRFKASGGHGGHNGLRSTIESFGGRDGFRRLRIGVGHPGSKSQVIHYVLSDPPAGEASIIESRISDAIAVLPQAAAGDWEGAMRVLHGGN